MKQSVAPRLVEVPLNDGSTWTGTERELRTKHPTWISYARLVQPSAEPVQELEELELDLQDDPHPGRMPSSARRWQPIPGQQQVEYDFQEEIVHTNIPRRSSAQRETEEQPATRTGRKPHPNLNHAQPPEVIHVPARRRRQVHWLLPVGLTAALIIGGVILLNYVSVWWTNTQNTNKYEYPRVYQTDAVVGHNDSAKHPSHFLALNLHGQIEVIEIPGGDPKHERVYLGPDLFGFGDDLIPVTVSFQDVDGSGKPAMLIHIQDQTIIFLNRGGQFTPSSQ